jgi:hypothetical protein
VPLVLVSTTGGALLLDGPNSWSNSETPTLKMRCGSRAAVVVVVFAAAAVEAKGAHLVVVEVPKPPLLLPNKECALVFSDATRVARSS